MDGGQRIADSLWAHGARCLFTLCGGDISPILVAAKSRGIDVVDVRDEATAVFAADAVARLTGIPGVAAVTAGPGVTNTITAVENARLSQSPLVLLGGATATVLAGRGPLQDIDQLRALRPHVKRVLAVRRVGDLGQAIARAFALARDRVPGPVFVQCPVDVLYHEHVVRDWYAKSMPPRGPARWYLRRHLERMLDAPPVERSPSARGRPAVVIPPRAIGRAAGLLARAERPVLLVGTQALEAGADSAALARAVDALGVPVFLSGMARGLLGPAHALHGIARIIQVERAMQGCLVGS